MSVTLKQLKSKVSFGNVSLGAAFIHRGVIYIKIKPAIAIDNAYRVGATTNVLTTIDSGSKVEHTTLEVTEV